MLQQTQAPRVAPIYVAFIERFPTVETLAAASPAEVLRAWAGLGYNRRAVALHESARAIVREHGGRVPADVDSLRRLPGVGPYTAAAVASIGHRLPVAAIDTNVRRLAARVFFGANPEGVEAAALRASVEGWIDVRAPGEWNQALMDLGREVCRPLPRCGICPLRAGCGFRAKAGGSSPMRSARPARRPEEAFEGSRRQLRGRLVQALRERPSATLAQLTAATGRPLDRVAAAVSSLASEGLVRGGPAALHGRAAGRVRLPDRPSGQAAIPWRS